MECAGCGQEVGDDYQPFDMPTFDKFSTQEYFTFGRARFCAACRVAIESSDYDESDFQR